MTGPRSLATILPGLLTQLGLAETVAGARIARRTRAVSFHEGTLSVEVEGSAWMHELGFLRRELVRNLNRHLDAEVVRDVRFVPAGTRPRGTGARPSGWAGGSLR
jgi:predicted nucleic acid-binding Zn ribbon protein